MACWLVQAEVQRVFDGWVCLLERLLSLSGSSEKTQRLHCGKASKTALLRPVLLQHCETERQYEKDVTSEALLERV